MQKALKDKTVAYVLGDQSAETADPTDRSSDNPAMAVAAKSASILSRFSLWATAMRAAKPESLPGEFASKRTTVVGSVSNHEVSFLRCDRVDNLFLATHRVDGDQGLLQCDSLQKLGNRRDFVGFLVGFNLAKGDPLLACPRTDNVQRPLTLCGIMRTTARLAVDGNESFVFIGRWQNGMSDPLLKAFLKGGRREHHEQSTKAITRRDSIGQREKLLEPILAKHCPTMDGGWPIASADNAADNDHDDVAEQMFAIAFMPRIRKRLEVRSDCLDVDELFCHGCHPGKCFTDSPMRSLLPNSVNAALIQDIAKSKASHQSSQTS